MPLPQVPIEFDAFQLKGGLDLHTPQLQLPAGVARDALNWECSINGGYTRIPGYERYDGRPSPTDAVYTSLQVSAVAGIAIGDTVNGQTSAATGVVADINGLVVVLTKTAGTMVVGENLRKVVAVIGVVDVVGVPEADQTVLARYQLAASAIYRADIAAPTGVGAVLGGFNFNSVNYCVRNNGGGTAAVLYKSTTSGWVSVTLPYEVGFTGGGGTQPAEGSTITKGAVSAVVRRVVVESGSFTGANAAGRFIVDTPTGGSFTAGALTAGGTATLSATLTGGAVQLAVSLLPGGRFEFDIGNAGNGVRVYGADGVNRGFEFDGTTLVPINTGMVADTPLHVRVHKRHLFFSFLTSAQHSGVGTPYVWSPVLGAAELGVNANITGFLVLPGTTTSAALAIFSGDTFSILYGTGTTDWNLVENTARIGSKPYAAQQLSAAFFFDDNGVTTLQAVQAYGNFTTATLTANLRSFVQARRTLVTDSLVNREKSQYRLFFSDGYGLYVTYVNGRFVGAMPVKFPNTVACTWSGASVNGGEISYFGSTNGTVYRLDVGTSFDGATIDHFFQLAFAAQRNARVRKRYRKAVLEIQGDSYSEFSAGYSLAYGDEALSPTVVATSTSPVYWDQFTWDQFIWDGRAIAPSQISLEGSAENISLRIEGSSAYWAAFTINSITLHYTPRRIIR